MLYDGSKEQWGYLRENKKDADKAGIDVETKLHRTGLDEYLAAIYPDINDWIHDKTIANLPEGVKCKKRPDYRSEKLKIIIEFDGMPHFQSPMQIRKDNEATKLYESFGYQVIRIPYFIQLTNQAIEKLFGIELYENMFNPNIPSLGIERGSPASLCPAGIQRMAEIFKEFPEQYKINLSYLKSLDDDYLTGASLLEEAYNKLK